MRSSLALFVAGNADAILATVSFTNNVFCLLTNSSPNEGEMSGQSIHDIEHDRADSSRAAKQPNEIYYSLYANLCSDPTRIKQYLEDSGMFNRLVVNRMSKLLSSEANTNNESSFRPGYVVTLLGACAMSLGCTLPTEFFEHLRATYAHRTRVGLMRDAVSQMSKALFGPNGYTNGTAYDFGSKGIDAMVKAGGPPFKDRYFPHPQWINVPSPSGVLPEDLLQELMATGRFESYEKTAQYLMKKFEVSEGEV